MPWYPPHSAVIPIPPPYQGVLVANSEGRSTLYAMGELQSRGTFFIEPGADVYGGMIIGENNRCGGTRNRW